MSNTFNLQSPYKPAGDQPKAIAELVESLKAGNRHQTLLGVTGSGKTFTVANVIQQIQKPTLVIAHNKTLAAQLAQEYREFFPHNAVHYFVSYYDYYQPEAYMPTTDTYIEKEAMINEEIDRLRHASTQALLSRKDVIIVASVSCIYGLGSPAEYEKVHVKLDTKSALLREELLKKLVHIHFTRTNADITPGTFRSKGNMVEIMPTSERVIYRISFEAGHIREIAVIDAITRVIQETRDTLFIFPAKHFITSEEESKRAYKEIKEELAVRLKELNAEGKLLEAQRLKRRTEHDLALIREVGYCNGIENYSRHFEGRVAGEPPHSLLSYFPHHKDGSADFLTVIDESHVSVSQIGGMYAGDRSRKATLIEHGFRLPSAFDNRPLTFDEFEKQIGQTVYTSATPGTFEREHSTVVAEQIIRPTGLLDPELVLRPVTSNASGYDGQVKDFIREAGEAVEKGGRVLVTTLTKKMAEDLAEFLKEKNIKAEYLHSDVKTMDRIVTLTEFRKGTFDVLVGVNLLREGLDLPEVSLVGILDADKEGFLRSETSLIQTIGRAARNIAGRVILYADTSTKSLEAAVGETNRRRAIQAAYNKKHNITPLSIKKTIHDITDQLKSEHQKAVGALIEIEAQQFKDNPKALIKEKINQMGDAVKELDFETAAIIRDEIKVLEAILEKQKKQEKKKLRANE